VSSNRYFVEIGAADGIQNNTAWLAVTERYAGVMIDGDARLVRRAQRIVAEHSIGAECRHLFVTREDAAELGRSLRHRDPDVFSLDIDGNDYYVARALLEGGVRPRIFVVEYNSAFGPERSLTIAYEREFVFTKAHPSHLYYGVSLRGWRELFAKHGYEFVTVDQNGVNAVFVDPGCFAAGFLRGIVGLEFAENQYQLTKFRVPWDGQFARIADQRFVSI